MRFSDAGEQIIQPARHFGRLSAAPRGRLLDNDPRNLTVRWLSHH